MARLKGGINGGFIGKVGNVIGVERDGKYYVRSANGSINDPKTDAQLAQRMRIGLASTLTKLINPYIQQGFKFVSRTVRGESISNIMKGAVAGDYPDLYIDYQYLKVASGLLMPPKSATTEFDASGGLSFQWEDNSGESNARAEDRVMLLVINPDLMQCTYELEGAQRSAGHDLIKGMPDSFKEGPLYAYMAFISADGSMVSDSVFVPLV